METATVETPVKKKRLKGRSDDAWTEPFLEYYEKWGAVTLAAKEMGMTAQAVHRYKHAHPEFAKRLEAAHELFVDGLEKTLLEMGRTGKGAHGFIAIVSRLKAERPNRWNEKLQISGVVAHLNAGPPSDQVKALLREMLADSSPETRAQLTAGDVIEGEKIPIADSPNEQEVNAAG